MGLCPKCVLNNIQFELEISFGASKSKFYYSEADRAKCFIYYMEEERNGKLLHIVTFKNLDEYPFEYRENNIAHPYRFLDIISKWKSFGMKLNSRAITMNELYSINRELDRVRLKK